MKKELTASQLLEKRQKQQKFIRKLQPIIRWLFLGIAIVLLIVAFTESFGNIAEIVNMLDGKTYTDAELQSNYAILIEKYGEWIIGSGNSGFIISFVNIGNALFSGVMIISIIFSIVCFAISWFGKHIMPKWADKLESDNQYMTNKAMLESIEEKK